MSQRISRAMGVTVLLCVAAGCLAQDAAPAKALPIIPGGHQGFGMDTPAGSGRHLARPRTQIIKVTNLNTKGPGSLRAALDTQGPRVIVFEVSGNIDFSPFGGLSIKHPYVTIAGQTAPSPGITLQACELNINTHDVLMQHIRVRVGDLLDTTRPLKNAAGWTQYSERDCMKVAGERIVIDHCSFSWATDENVQTRGNDLTLCYNIISEGLDSSAHHKGGHSRGLLIMNQGPKTGTDSRREGQRVAVIGNLFVHNKGRNPTLNGGATGVVVNNFIYNANFAMKADCVGLRSPQLISLEANAMRRVRNGVVARAKHPQTRYYVGTNNLFNGQQFNSMQDIWKNVSQPFEPGVPEANRAATPPITIPGYKVKPTAEVERWVLSHAGARPNDRDPVDTRVVADVVGNTGKVIGSQDEVGGWPALAKNHRKLTVPKNPNADDDGDGYTNLEEWLHSFAAEVEGNHQ